MVYNETLFDRYLNILGIGRREPSITALYEIIMAHLTKVPFENISKLLYKKQGLKYIPVLSVYLDGIEKFNFGGTCYSNNYYLYLLLKYLGYDVKLCGADMKNPDVHVVSMVKIGEQDFIVDVGYAAPFTEPLPGDLKKNYVITFGDEKYILNPRDESGYSKLEQYYKGELKHGNAVISHKHANMFVTKDNATSDDVIMLARKIQMLVFENFPFLYFFV